VCEDAELIWVSTGMAGDPIALGISDGKLRFCRDLVIRRNPEQVAVLARHAIFKPFGMDSSDIDYKHSEIAPAVIRIDARSSGDTASVVLAIQPITGDRAGLHVLAGGNTEAERRHYADWARRLRWFMENPENATTSWRPFMVEPT
ncbi:MAG: hypothetical protein VX741_15125, partial [Pseudomonadota bacterium]|nr:hypothetical protein [Pseudomonadota bacterium]